VSAELPNQPLPGASVLIVGLTTDVFERISKMLAPHGIQALMTSLARLRTDAVNQKPLVVLVDAYLYDFDPLAFNHLASDVGAQLGVISNAKEGIQLLENLLQPSAPKEVRPDKPPKPAAVRREFDTAKYDAKTLHEALERMGTKRPAFDTARYDAKTLHAALERLNAKSSTPAAENHDPDALHAGLDEMASKEGVSETAQGDAKTLHSPLEKMSPQQADAKTSTYNAALLRKLLDESDD
jgi:hypothetical protein